MMQTFAQPEEQHLALPLQSESPWHWSLMPSGHSSGDSIREGQRPCFEAPGTRGTGGEAKEAQRGNETQEEVMARKMQRKSSDRERKCIASQKEIEDRIGVSKGRGKKLRCGK